MSPSERRLITTFYREVERSGIPLSAALMLVRLADMDGPTNGELADILMLSDPAISRMRRKVPANAIRQEPIDARSFRLYLTKEGHALLDRLIGRDDDEDL